MVGKIPDHGAATYHMMRGYPMTPAIKHPTIGTVVNHEYKPRTELPSYIAIGNSSGETGYLGSQYGPFTTGADPASGNGFKVQDLVLPGGLSVEAFEGRMRMREVINSQFRKLETNTAALDSMDAYYQQAYKMISSSAVRDAFDLSKESKKMKEVYGAGLYDRLGNQAGLRMLMARRLVEAGARPRPGRRSKDLPTSPARGPNRQLECRRRSS